jgi:hypothetical protein
MSEIKDGGPAFPVQEQVNVHGEHVMWAESGMTLRDYFAIRAPEPTKDRMDLERMKDRNRNPHNDSYKPPIRSDMEIRCALAYEYASAMLKAREA